MPVEWGPTLEVIVLASSLFNCVTEDNTKMRRPMVSFINHCLYRKYFLKMFINKAEKKLNY